MQHIAIIGGESSGKTTLTRLLAQHFGTSWNPEFVRDFASVRAGDPLSRTDLDVIFWGQYITELQAARRGRPPFVFLDTNLLMSIVYADYYQGVREPVWERVLSERTYTYLLMCPDFPWQADALREGEAVRQAIDARLREELESRGLPYHVLGGSVEARLRDALAVLLDH